MDIYKRITFNIILESVQPIRKRCVWFILKKKGLKYVWEEICPQISKAEELEKLRGDSIEYNLYVDFSISDKKKWFTSGIGLIRIPFHEDHLK